MLPKLHGSVNCVRLAVKFHVSAWVGFREQLVHLPDAPDARQTEFPAKAVAVSVLLATAGFAYQFVDSSLIPDVDRVKVLESLNIVIARIVVHMQATGTVDPAPDLLQRLANLPDFFQTLNTPKRRRNQLEPNGSLVFADRTVGHDFPVTPEAVVVSLVDALDSERFQALGQVVAV